MPSKRKADGGHISRGKTIQYSSNRILAALPPEEFRRLAPHLVDTPLKFSRSLSNRANPSRTSAFLTAASAP